MSFQAMTWAANQKLPAMQKIVLLMLANRTSSDNKTCYPSHDTLAEDCGMTKRSVIRQIAKLEQGGFLTVFRETKNGVKQVNNYQLCLIRSEPRSLGIVTDVHQGSDLKSLGVVTESHINQSIETVIEPIITITGASAKNENGKIELTEQERLCYEWAIRSEYWQKTIHDNKSFMKIWNSPKGTLKSQFRRHLQQKEGRNRLAEEKAQKSQLPTTNGKTGLVSNNNLSNGNNYARSTRTKQPQQFTADYYTNDTTAF
jgi:hypothetical protein